MSGVLKRVILGSYFRLVVFCGAVAVLPALFALTLNDLAAYRQKRAAVLEKIEEVAAAANARQAAIEASALALLRGLAVSLPVSAGDHAAAANLFQYMLNSASPARSLAWYSGAGQRLALAGPDEGKAMPLNWADAGEQRAPGIVGAAPLVLVDAGWGTLLFILPLRNGAEGFLTAALPLSRYQSAMLELAAPFGFSPFFLSREGQWTLAGQDGIAPAQFSGIGPDTGSDMGQQAPQLPPGAGQGVLWLEGPQGSSRPLAFVRRSLNAFQTPYLDTLLVPSEDVLAEAGAALPASLIGAACAWLLSFGVLLAAGILVFRRPMLKLLEISRLMGEGRFEAAEECAKVGGAFSEYALALRDMAAVLSKREEDMCRAKREAEAAARVKSEFMANISHEIRTPMNAILGMAYLAQKGDPSPRQLAYIQKMRTTGQNLLHIIDDILDLSKLEAGRLSMENTSFAIRDLFSSISSAYRRQTEEKNIKLVIDVAPDVPLTLMGDPMRLEQAVSQLVDNAMRHTCNGTVRLSCSLAGIARNDCALRILVADTGEGMRPEFLDALNKAMLTDERSMRSWSAHSQGGLGLPIAHRLFRLMNGDLQVSSELGRGTVFTCKAHFGYYDSEQGRRDTVLADKRVLLVDADASVLNLHSGLLQNFAVHVRGFEQVSAAIGELTAADARGAPYDFFILDWHNADKELGILMRHIRARLCLSRQPKIIITSAFGREDVRRVAEEARVDAFLHKPIHGSVLLDALMDLGDVGDALWPGNNQAGQRAAQQPEAVEGLRALLVEDNRINQLMACEIMESAGITATVTGNGAEALRAIAAHQGELAFDVVLMDLRMPGMDGFEATWRIRKDKWLKAEHVPLIAMTAHRNTDEIEACLRAGMDDHIPKPVEPQVFFNVLRRWLPVSQDHSGGAARCFQKLEKLLEEGSPEASLFFAEWRNRLRPFLGAGRTDKIQRMIDGGRWREALCLTADLREKVGRGENRV